MRLIQRIYTLFFKLACLFLIFFWLSYPVKAQIDSDSVVKENEGFVLQEVLGNNLPAQETKPSPINYLIGIWAVVFIVIVVIVIYGAKTERLKINLQKLSFKRSTQTKMKKVDSKGIKRDEQRKKDLERIQAALTQFHAQHSRFPDAKTEEFKNLLLSLKPLPKDPLEGKDIGVMSQKYGYYYDNQNDLQYFKLWCVLENPDDLEAQHYYNNTLHLYVKTATDTLTQPQSVQRSVVNPNQVKQETVQNITTTPEKQRDLARKSDIKKIREQLTSFFQTNRRYPNQTEYTDLISKINPPPSDSRQGEDSGFNDQPYGYYYDNLILDSANQSANDFQTYRLWCLLESSDDPEILHDYDSQFHWIYMKTHLDPL